MATRRHGKSHCISGLVLPSHRSLPKIAGGVVVGTVVSIVGTPLHVVTLLPLLRYGLELAVSSDQSGPQSWLGSDGPAAFTRYRIDGSTPGQPPEGSE